jgi:hypothetical protein
MGQNKDLIDLQRSIAEEITLLLTNHINQINPLIRITDFLDEFESGYKWINRYYW